MLTRPSTSINKPRVFVGLSGGVDSSVSAALLLQAGYTVTGVFIKVWSPEWLLCDWREERRDAMRVAAHLGIPFLTFDLEDVYKKNVADYFLAEYKAGRTPNPDVLCNREVKFGAFLRLAREQGADFIATGHYAQNVREDGVFHLKEGVDPSKDQSYFLWTLGQEELAHTLFPVGYLYKNEVRIVAKKLGLPTAAKKDSQGICFLGPVDMKEFLAHYMKPSRGKVLNQQGTVIGEHPGALFFTLGERHGFTLSETRIRSEPHYVVAKNLQANTITVAPAMVEQKKENVLKIILESTHWVAGRAPVTDTNYLARYRYHQQPQQCRLEVTATHTTIIFETPQEAVSSGQSLVLYTSTDCLGGGTIASTE